MSSGEIVVSYTQVYDTLPAVASHLSFSASMQLMMFLLPRLEHNTNRFQADTELSDEFQSTFDLSDSMYKKALKQLKDTGIIIQERKGCYVFNPHLAWRGDTAARLDWLKNNVNNSQALNPLK